MKPIPSPPEPACFQTFRAHHPTDTWDQFKSADRDCAAALRDALIGAQRGLCAFCEIGLVAPLYVQVEHWHPKADPTRNWGLDFANLMAGCEGGTARLLDPTRRGEPIRETMHCGPAKGDEDHTAVLLDPRSDLPLTPAWVLDPNGHIEPHPDLEPQVRKRAERTIEVLNLDSTTLRRLRAQVWTELGNDVQAAWEVLGPTEDDYVAAWREVVEARLAVHEGRLNPFWSIIRHFGDLLAEDWLAGHPEVFAAP